MVNDYDKSYYDKNKEKFVQWQRNDRLKHKERYENTTRRNNSKSSRYRRDILEFLGSKCKCYGISCWHIGPCDITDLRCLQLDHINGNGEEERKRFGGNFAMYIYYHARLELAVGHFQPLCANCNWVKKYNNKENNKFFCKIPK